jgi:hypothetical protein
VSVGRGSVDSLARVGKITGKPERVTFVKVHTGLLSDLV